MTINYESLAKAQLKDEELLNFLENNHFLMIKSVPVAEQALHFYMMNPYQVN